MLSQITIPIIVSILLSATIAVADCTSPAAVAGAREFNTGTGRFQLCNGTSWIDFSTNGTMAGCSGNGKLEFDTGANVFKYCNASVWQRAEKPACTISSVTWLSKIAADATALQNVSAATLSADGTILYTAGRRIAKWTFSGATPPVPVKTGHSALLAASENSQEIEVYGNYLFSYGDAGAFTVWNVSGATPTLVATRAPIAGETGTGNGLELSPDGQLAYAVTHSAGGGSKTFLHIFDISNPLSTAAPIGSLELTAYAFSLGENIYLSGNTAFIVFAYEGGTKGGVVSVNISNPAAPTYISRLSTTNMFNANGSGLSADGKYLYTSNFQATPNRMNVINVTNPAAMTATGSATNANIYESYDGKALGNYYLNSNVFGTCQFQVWNVATPASPTLAGTDGNCTTKSNGPGAFVVRGRYVYTGDYSGTSISTWDLGCDPLGSGSMGTCSVAGQIDYQAGNKALVFCNGTNWKIMAR